MKNEKNIYVPKYACGDKLYAVDMTNEKIVELDVDEICINKLFGVSYRFFKSMEEFYQYPESVCFLNKSEAEEQLAINKQVDETAE